MVRSKEYHFIQYWNGIHGIEIQEMVRDGRTALSLGNVGSINHFVLSDQILWLDRQWSIELFVFGGCFGIKDVLF